MRIPFEWLKEFLVIEMDAHELARRLTLRGLEVETIEEIRPLFKGVVVGEILSIEQHPETENLLLCTVTTGAETLPIVCGAKNIRKGDKVPVALPGGTLADNTLIEVKNIKGIESQGMLCSEKELGLSEDHSGIFILPGNFGTGQMLESIPDMSDVVFDINVPPNRGDCLSVYGIAREVGGIVHQKAKLPSFEIQYAIRRDIKEYISLDILNTHACPRYVLRMIEGISILPSPYWMRARIMKCGMRPINSIVDVTNYVMLELGQPLHAFDYERLAGKKIEVRLAERERYFTTLDGIERRLEAGDILICDGSGPVAIAGIMGGKNSEITDDTTHVALESAYFNPLFIRKTARRLGLKSEASLRFEKGIDIDLVDVAAQRAMFLFNLTSGGKIVKGKKEVHSKKEKKTISVSFGRINEVLGVPVEHLEVINGLRSIDLFVSEEGDGGISLTVPNFRHDINEYMDIIEEVARIMGYDHIPPTAPITSLAPQKRDKKTVSLQTAKDYFTSCGFYELINFGFFSIEDIQNFFIPDTDERASYVEIVNPLSKDMGIMRTMLAPGILKSMAYNINRGSKNLRFFEMGKIFVRQNEGMPLERYHLSFALTGKERDYFWREPQTPYDFYDLKGILEGLCATLHLDCTFKKTEEPFLKGYNSADIFLDNTKIGWLGELKDEVLKNYEIEQNIYCAEIGFDIMIQKGISAVKYTPIPRYPQVTRDFSFFVDEAIPVATLIQHIRTISPLITAVGIFDMYKKEERSVSFRVVFQSHEETLQDTVVNTLQETIIKELTRIKGVTLRT